MVLSQDQAHVARCNFKKSSKTTCGINNFHRNDFSDKAMIMLQEFESNPKPNIYFQLTISFLSKSLQFYVLCHLFPPTIECQYSLCRRKHDFVLPQKDDKNVNHIGCCRVAYSIDRAFSIVGPSVWNSLPSEICSLPRDLSSLFYKLLKTFIFARAWAGSASQ